jgi:hypothetical protein
MLPRKPPIIPPARPRVKDPPIGLPTAWGAWVCGAGFDAAGAFLNDRPPPFVRASAVSINPVTIKKIITVKAARIILVFETLSIIFSPSI